MVSWPDLRNLHARVRFLFLVSDVDESDNFCRFRGVCHRPDVTGRISSCSGACDDIDDQCETFVLWDFYAGQVSGNMMEKVLSDLWDV